MSNMKSEMRDGSDHCSHTERETRSSYNEGGRERMTGAELRETKRI